MECELPTDQNKKARIDSPPGLGVSDGVMQEILTTIRRTDGQLTKMGRELKETKQLSAKTVKMATTTQDEVRNWLQGLML